MLKDIFKENFWKIIATYSITLLEFTAFSLMPYVIGLAIDDLISGKKDYLFIYAALLFGALIIGTARRMFDTRVFCRIYFNKATQVIGTLRKSNLDSKRIISRYGLVGFYSDFFEYTLPNIFNVIIGIVISLVMILYIEGYLIVFIIPAVILEIISHKYFSKIIQAKEYEMQNLREEISHDLADNKDCTGHLEEQLNVIVKKSDLESYSWAVADSISCIIEITCLLLITSSNLTLGEITSVLMYTNRVFEKAHLSYHYFISKILLEMSDDLLGNTK